MTRSKTAAFEAFCHAHHSSVVNALTWTLGDWELANDAANEAFARAFERWDRLSGASAGANPAGWVYTTGLNWARRRMRRSKRELELTRAQAMGVGEPPLDRIDQLELRRALLSLSLNHRSVVVLRLLLQHTEAETAQALGIEIGTVKSRMSRGLAKLREELIGERVDD